MSETAATDIEPDYIEETASAVLAALSAAGVGEGNGRPSVFTKRTITKLLEALERGNFYEPACHYAGISYRTFRRWMSEGENDDSESTPQFVLWQAVKRAEAISENARLGRIESAAGDKRNYMADIILLSRRHRDRWADQVPQQQTGAPQIAIGVQVQVLPQPLSPVTGSATALSPAIEIAVSDARLEAKGPPIEGVSPADVA